MVLKLSRAAWFLSTLGLLAGLLLAYAGWREELIVAGSGEEVVRVGREGLFYGLAIFFSLVNVLVYVIGKFYASDENFRAWFHGLILTVNVFFVVAVNYIGLVNSGETYDFSRSQYFLYGSIFLIVLWAVSWPFYRFYQKMFIKQAI